MEAKYLADDATQWNYDRAPANTKVTLLNIGKVQSTGHWTGRYGEAFIAWAPLIKSSKNIEAVLEFFKYKHTWLEVLASPELQAQLPPNLLELCSSEKS